MDTAPVVMHDEYPSDIGCINCGKAPMRIGDTWEVLGVAPVCGQCAGTCSKPRDRRRCEPCDNCGLPTPFNRFPDGMTGHICVPCYAARRPHSPAQLPGASHAPASATASASPAGAAAGESACRTCKVCGEQISPGYPQVVGANVCMRCWPEYVAQHRKSIAASHSSLAPNPSPLVWYDRPILTAGLPIGVASLLLLAAAVDRVVDSGAPWHEVGEILSAMAPVLATFSIILALAIGWMLRGLQLHLRAEPTGSPDADSQPIARPHNQ